ncbi:MAG: hypothetical protein H6741_34435, partial [Alphaproteobacteria bacterium]|nr:hypothetical protein [Alphaproteobacteria bacterium]
APTYDAARGQSAAVLNAQRTELSDSLPELPTPTGLAPTDAAPPALDTSAPDANAEVQVPEGEGATPKPEATETPEAPPAPAQPATQITGSESEGQGDEQVAASANQALASVSIPTAAVPTVDPDKPTVTLSGDADPQRMGGAKQSADGEVARAHQQALAQAGQDFGEGDIAPASDAELLSASTALSAPAALDAPEAGAGGIPAEMIADVDAQAGPVLDERLQAGLQQYEQGQAQFDRDSQAARDKADADILLAESDATQTQTDARSGAQTEVGAARADWQSQIEQVKGDAASDAESARVKQLKAIQGKKTDADTKARKHIQDGERKAEAKKRDAERKAEAKKSSAKKESGGFWGWVKSKARAFVDGLKAAVNAIYEGLRAAVKAIFELAKQLAVGVIELAQKAIVGLIKAYGEILKAVVKVALAAFPKLAAEINKRIDAAVKKATEIVNKAAELLKKGVSAILDFLASTIDKLLSLVQSLYNAAFTLIGMIVSGEWKEILAGLKNLVTAAGEAPPQFEAAAYEEVLGGDMDQPLSAAELQLAGLSPKLGAGDEASMGMPGAMEGEAELPGPPWTPDNVGVEQVISGMELGPELSKQIMQQTGGGDGEVQFGQSDDPSRSMEGILGVDPAQMKVGGGDIAQQLAPDDGLSVGERASARWTIMKKGLSDWWSKNWPMVVGGGVLAVGGFIAANILTGGAVLAALPAIMSALGPLFMGMMAAQVGGYVSDYLSKGWAGDTRPAGKSLAKALAVGAIELISALTFKAGGAALKGAKAVAKGVAKGAKAAAKGAMKLMRRGANYVLKKGKVLLKGLGSSGLGKSFRRLDDFGKGLLKRTKFKGFRLKVKSRRFALEGKVNPWVKLAEGKLVEVDSKTAGAIEVDDIAKTQRDFDNLQKLRRQSGESIEQWKSRVKGIQDDAMTKAMHGDDAAEELFDMADDFLDPQKGKIAKQQQIANADEMGQQAWKERQQVWEGLKLKGGKKADAAFWKRIDSAASADDLAKAAKELDELEDVVKSWKNAEKNELLKDLMERRAKLDHKRRRLAAKSNAPKNDDALVDQILNGGKGDVYATSKKQAETVQDFLEATERNSSKTVVKHDGGNFHGPEQHRGSRFNTDTGKTQRGINRINGAPDQPHLNVKGGAGGAHYETHIYYPE